VRIFEVMCNQRSVPLNMTRRPRRKRGLLTVRKAPGRVGRDRYVVRWLKGNPYLYLRQYLGAKRHGTPALRDVYLGRLPLRLALKGSEERLSEAAHQLRRRYVRRLLREGLKQMRRAKRRRR